MKITKYVTNVYSKHIQINNLVILANPSYTNIKQNFITNLNKNKNNNNKNKNKIKINYYCYSISTATET